MPLNRGEIYYVNLGSTRGREQAGTRPVLIVSNDVINARPLVVAVVVGTDGANVPRNHLTNVRVPAADSGLPLETVFLCFQIRSLDSSRFPAAPVGKLSANSMSLSDNALRYCLDL